MRVRVHVSTRLLNYGEYNKHTRKEPDIAMRLSRRTLEISLSSRRAVAAAFRLLLATAKAVDKRCAAPNAPFVVAFLLSFATT